MSGDRWVVRYPTGEWGVERSSRRMSSQLFACVEDALQTAREEATAAGGGEIAVQGPDGGLSLREQVTAAPRIASSPRATQDGAQGTVAWTVFA